MKEIVFASGNLGKLKEVREFFLEDGTKILGTNDFNIENYEVDEDKDTLEGNAEKKALSLFDIIKREVFADDTGLFVECLGGEPGVKSARYAGDKVNFSDNISKLLKEMADIDKENRKAYFKSVIAYVDKDRKVHFFEGRIDGYIAEFEKGNNGFGYDALFYLPKYNKTFAEMTNKEKASISHRTIALQKFRKFISL